MERESFIFYRSFYEAIRNLPDNIRLEVFTAITEYALYGKQPENLKPFASGMFVLIKPNLDANIHRYENGTKGGRKPGKTNPAPGSTAEAAPTPPAEADPGYTTFEEEVALMRKDQAWSEAICMQFRIDPAELDTRLQTFVTHLKVERSGELHPTLKDARRHLTSWMRKAYPPKESCKNRAERESAKTTGTKKRTECETPDTTPDDYTYRGGFGGQD